jgi:hypothetical protein
VSVLRDYQSEIIDDFDCLVARGMRSVPIAGFIRALGGDRLAAPRAVGGGWG